MTESRFYVDHVRIAATRPFADVQAAFERRLGRFELGVYQRLAADDADPARVRASYPRDGRPSGFMLFAAQDHGRLLRLVGRHRKDVQYDLGNPLFAVEMTRNAIGASLYAPLRVLIYEADDGQMCIQYDKPSSLFGQFGDERVGRMAAVLDRKLEDLADAAMRDGPLPA